MSSEDRRQRDLDLLMKSYKALEAEQHDDNPAPTAERSAAPRGASPEPAAAPEHDDDVVMYRGRPVRRSKTTSVPGSSSHTGKSRQFRGSGPTRSKGKTKSRRGESDATKGDSLKAALSKLAELHDEGLITDAQFDAKRQQILDRL